MQEGFAGMVAWLGLCCRGCGGAGCSDGGVVRFSYIQPAHPRP